MELDRLIKGLSQPAAYAHPVERVEICQTHISVVFLAGSFAYKVKKPVDFGFLDFSTLSKRRHYCDEEVRLNRRLAPQVYLGVVPITRADGELRMNGRGEAIEWAVVMQRLPEAATLQARLKRKEVDPELVQALANRIASFHRAVEANERIATFGRFDVVSKNFLDIFEQSKPHIGNTVSSNVLHRLLSLTQEALARWRPLIDERSRRGLTRDCHGDLHLDHVYYFPEHEPPANLVIIDCIEFNERFRYIDPVADMAFPVMDFVFFGRRDLARAFSEAYFQASSDDEGRPLVPLYTAYRASVRGSVEGLKLAEVEVAEADRQATLQSARAHWLVGLGELEEPDRRPCLVLVAGLPGTGKTTLARGLADQAGFSIIRSDVVRKELAGLPSQQTAPLQAYTLIYSTDWNDRTYAECLRKAELLLFQGKRVIVDATFREEQRRHQFLETATSWGVPVVILLTHAEPETVRRRLEQRREDASDANWAVYLHIAECWEEPAPSTRQAIREIATDGSAEEFISAAIASLREFCVKA